MANELEKESIELNNELITFGNRNRKIRKHRGLTLAQMEALCGLQETKLSKIERGKINIEFQTILKIAKALQVEIKEIFDYDGELPDNKKFKYPFPKKRKI